MGGKIEDKEGLRKAFRKADFPSVRGNFRFNHNNFPIQNFYIRKIVKNAKGELTTQIMETAFTDHADAYEAECPMK